MHQPAPFRGDANASLAHILAHAIESSDKPKHQIAREVGIHRETLLRVMRGNRPIGLDEAARVLDVCGAFSTPLTLRVHRALSWLRRAEAEQDDQDVRFILLWIGFNAAYAGDVEASASSSAPEGERGLFQSFFSTLVKFDGRHRVYDAVWQRFSQEIRLLLDNRYVYHPFWQHQNGAPGYEDWEHKLERGRIAINHALREHDTVRILSILFDRLYVLRNQLVHGGATWNSDVNRDQVRDGASLLGCLLPIFVDLMMDNPQHEWPMPNYPVVD